MDFSSWAYLMVKNGPGVVPDEIRDALIIEACLLVPNKTERKIFSNDVCAGYITTEWKSTLVGTRGGIIFKSHIEDFGKGFQINFILSEDDLDDGLEMIKALKERDGSIVNIGTPGQIPVSELYEFMKTQSSRMN